MRIHRPRSAHGGTETGALCRPRQFFSPTRAARAAPALNQLRLLGFSFLNSFFFLGRYMPRFCSNVYSCGSEHCGEGIAWA